MRLIFVLEVQHSAKVYLPEKVLKDNLWLFSIKAGGGWTVTALTIDTTCCRPSIVYCTNSSWMAVQWLL